MLTPSSIPINNRFAQNPIANPIKNSFNKIKVNAGTDVGIEKLVFACTIGNNINAIAADSQILTCAGIGYVENSGADVNNPDNLVNIAIKSIILLIENRISRLNILHCTYQLWNS